MRLLLSTAGCLIAQRFHGCCVAHDLRRGSQVKPLLDPLKTYTDLNTTASLNQSRPCALRERVEILDATFQHNAISEVPDHCLGSLTLHRTVGSELATLAKAS